MFEMSVALMLVLEKDMHRPNPRFFELCLTLPFNTIGNVEADENRLGLMNYDE